MSVVIDGFPMDLAISEAYSLPGEVTQFPVEEGSEITDHIRTLPEEITLECIVSDTPIGEVAQHETRFENGAAVPLPSNDAFHKLVEIRNERRTVSISTSFGEFDDMAIESLEMPADKDRGNNSLFFTVKFKHITIVKNQRVRRRVATPMAGAGGKGKIKSAALVSFAVVDKRIVWRFGEPAGGPLKPNYQWAIVEQVQVNRSSASADRVFTGGDVFGDDSRTTSSTFVFRFTGEASPLVAASIKRNEYLTPAQRSALAKDLARDRATAFAVAYRDELFRQGALPPNMQTTRFQRREPPLRTKSSEAAPPLRTKTTEARRPIASGGG